MIGLWVGLCPVTCQGLVPSLPQIYPRCRAVRATRRRLKLNSSLIQDYILGTKVIQLFVCLRA